MKTFLFVFVNFLTILLVALISFVLFGRLTSEVIVRMASPATYELGSVVVYGVIAGLTGGLAALFSLLPSYKLSLKFAKYLEKKKGIKIENPKKLFLAALGILLLPLILLIIWGAIASACSSKPDKPEKPPKAIHQRCRPLGQKWYKWYKKTKWAKKHLLKNPCVALYDLNQIVDGEEEVAEVLPELLSTELTQNFSKEEFEAATEEAAETFGEIENISYPEGLTIQGDWAEAEIEITTTKGQTLKYLIIFHREDGAWKIFGTEEI